ncbi:YdcF family protein [Scytonema sp. UIC 10036]|uniref:YdcF family protein n=1 Tax=Scytonema sp. UIC 10036 TaxID=2304196 RepID=UPI0012DACBF7|nr:YdcF family protein [Scytonema sp. UIC 10036]MUG91401.1 YdcF family protein [Scytonema sp. UIC 10036]
MFFISKNLNKYRFLFINIAAIPFLVYSTILLRLTIAYHQAPRPQAILTLGGSPDRPKFTAQFAQKHSSLDIWVSSGLPPERICPIFQAANISKNRIHLNYEAVDTVTNFTTLIDNLKRHEIRHLYLITSDFHMPRARAIATIVLGSQGITFTPIAVPTERPTEAWLFTLLDSGRALFWLFTGYTGASLNAYFSYDQLENLL